MNIITASNSYKAYFDKRMLFIFLNGIASGFPWVIIGSAMTLWLKDAGLSRSAIGFFGSIYAVYSINWMWAPLVDSVKIPFLHRLGQRRSWILLMQIIILLFTLILSLTNPQQGIIWTSIIAIAIAIASATQDIAIDAYRIDIISKKEHNQFAASSAMATSGWWTGFSIPGAIALFLASYIAWSNVYIIISIAFTTLFIINTLWIKEPETNREKIRQQIHNKTLRAIENKIGKNKLSIILSWFTTVFVESLKDFFTRFGLIAIGLFAFILLFKIGEAFLGRMALVFYKEIGFTTIEIATYSKLIGWFITIFFSIIASFISIHYGLIKGLFISGIAMASTNLIFAFMATVGPDTNIFFGAIVLDNFTSAFSTVTFVAFISYLTNRAYSATQYALMASLANFGRTLFASGSGFLIDQLNGNWTLFFIITALMVIPSLLILMFISSSIKKLF